MAMNALMLVRFWWLMRVMNFTLLAFIESNRQFAEMMDRREP
jgi:hypothetical protein